MKRVLKFFGCLLLVLVLAAGGYVAYFCASYSRLEDHLALDVVGGSEGVALSAGEPHSIVTWNLGFGAYSADYSFFMDGGTESRAYSKDAVEANIGAMIETLNTMDADLMLLQEVDVDATRSYHVDQSKMLTAAFAGRDSVFAQNYDSAYIPYPLNQPHGASKAGQMTFSRAKIDSAERISLPVETGFTKFFDLDRCYSVSKIPTDDGKLLCLYNLHLSAYTSDGTIATEQFEILLDDMQANYDAGHYVIAGGDFNKDLLGNSPDVFGVSGEDYTWAQPLPVDQISESFELVNSLDPARPVPSCRNADRPYAPGESFVLTVDGFIVSKNVEVLSCEVYDAGFAHSDHNPVVLKFQLAA